MTREEEIDAMARRYTDNLAEIDRFCKENMYSAYIVGAMWADIHPKNVWHDESEEPKHGEDIIAICDGVPVAGVFMKHLFGKGIFRYHCLQCDWYSPQKWETVNKWAYIKDILPKGGNA